MRPTIALLPVLLILAACGDQTSAGGTGEPAATLDGRTFVGDQVDGHALVHGSTLRLTFADGNVGVTAGCNHLSGSARLDNGVLKVGQIGGTEMGCDADLMDQDTWIADFLQSSPAVTVDGRTLGLSTGGVTVTLTDEASIQAENPIEVEGTTWTLESILSGDAASSVPEGQAVTLTIESGHLVLSGCNEISAAVTVEGDRLVLTDPTTTDVGCPDAVEDDVLHVIQKGHYEQDYDSLTFTAGAKGYQFRAATR